MHTVAAQPWRFFSALAIAVSCLLAPGSFALASDSASSTNYADEMTDFGVSATAYPRTAQQGYGTPTPMTIPGGQVISTDKLAAMISGPNKPAIFVVYPAKSVIPGATVLAGAGEDRLFSKAQETFTRALSDATSGDKTRPVVFYCHGAKCWLSYNASLHAIEAGYTNVYWYRGGRDAWKASEHRFKKVKQAESGD
jgi:PQQ-dependent catabolism-associated CXXCW motif protein